jgi:hypothetical protein
MVAGAFKVTVVGAALLVTEGLAHRTVHVKDELFELAVLVGLVGPLPGAVHQELQVLFGAEGLGLEAGHLTGGSCRMVLGAAADHGPQGGIEAEALGVVDIFVAGQPAVVRWRRRACKLCWVFCPVRVSCRPVAAVLVSPRASSSSR